MSAPCRHCDGTGVQPDAVGPAMRELRRGLRLGMRDVARTARISATHLSNLERGARPWQGAGAERVEKILREHSEARQREFFSVPATPGMHGGAA